MYLKLKNALIGLYACLDTTSMYPVECMLIGIRLMNTVKSTFLSFLQKHNWNRQNNNPSVFISKFASVYLFNFCVLWNSAELAVIFIKHFC